MINYIITWSFFKIFYFNLKNGAGDAFVGGFLSQYVKGQSLEKAIDCGIWSSSLVIQRSGCTFPEKMDYQ